MELSIRKKDLERGLARTHAVADRKSSMPILSNILLSSDEGRLRFAATDLYLSVTASTEAQVSGSGTIALSAKTLFEIAKNLPDGEVQLQAVDSHAAQIRAGKARFKIPGMPGQDFPPLPDPDDAEFASLPAEELGRLIALTQYSMSTDETRPHLAGALLEGDGKNVRMVTTDGHRLSKAEFKLGDGAPMLNFQMLVPHKGVIELRRMIEEAKSEQGKGDDGPSQVEIATAGGNAFFRRADVLLSVKLADAVFPPYDKVIPGSHQRRLIIGRIPLLEALKRIRLVANDKSGSVRFQVEPGTLRLTSENPDVGEGSEELDIDYAGEPVEIGFNARYLIDCLNAVTEDEVALELGGNLDPGVVKPDGPTDFIGVVMPMRI
ncbi:MAG: DNA polymerase III subunit beta [Myxococcales bacterium]|nr:DNA polymerase III subunit beta [Myxococcales bacterium]